MAEPTYDDTEWPLVRIRLPSSTLSADEFEAFVSYIDMLHTRGTRFGVVVDVRDAPIIDATRRRILAERAAANYTRYSMLMVGMGIVMSSAIQRGINTAIRWIARDRHEIRAFAKPEDAERWIRSLL